MTEMVATSTKEDKETKEIKFEEGMMCADALVFFLLCDVAISSAFSRRPSSHRWSLCGYFLLMPTRIED
jgi:hypothetical protein